MGHSQLHSWVDNIRLKSSRHRTMTGVAYERIENYLLKTMHCIVVRESICVPCKASMSLDHHAGDAFEQGPLLSNFSKPDKIDSTSEMFRLRDHYTQQHILFCFAF